MNFNRQDRYFRQILVAPSILVLLLIAIFPLVYLILVSFQGITMTDNDTSFIGLTNYLQLLNDRRLWEAVLHTLFFLAIALPLELIFGLFMASSF